MASVEINLCCQVWYNIWDIMWERVFESSFDWASSTIIASVCIGEQEVCICVKREFIPFQGTGSFDFVKPCCYLLWLIFLRQKHNKMRHISPVPVPAGVLLCSWMIVHSLRIILFVMWTHSKPVELEANDRMCFSYRSHYCGFFPQLTIAVMRLLKAF